MGTQPAKGSFTNYVDKVLPNIDHLPTLCWNLWLNSFTGIGENMHTVDISSTPYLICLVNVVCEWPLKQGAYRWYYSLFSKIGPKELKIRLWNENKIKIWLLFYSRISKYPDIRISGYQTIRITHLTDSCVVSRLHLGKKKSAATRNRTWNRPIRCLASYQLSYSGHIHDA